MVWFLSTKPLSISESYLLWILPIGHCAYQPLDMSFGHHAVFHKLFRNISNFKAFQLAWYWSAMLSLTFVVLVKLLGTFSLKKKSVKFRTWGGGVRTKLGHFHTFLIFFLSCPKSCKSAKNFFLLWGVGYPLTWKSKFFGHLREKSCNFL